MKRFINISLRLLFLSGFFSVHSHIHSQEFHYELTGDPVDITGWTMGLDAIIDGSAIRLTNATFDQVGYIHYSEPQDLSGECSYFNVEFEYRMNNSGGLSTPADGLAFWFLEVPPSTFVSGGGMGMPSTMKGFALVMDVYNNDGVFDNPIVTLDTYDFTGYVEGFFGNSVGAPLLNQSYVNDNTWRHCRLEYDMGVMNVYLNHSTTPNISGTIDLDGIIGYFGFSAATGGAHQQHFVRNVSISGRDVPQPPVVSDTAIICQLPGGYDLSESIEESIAGGILYWYEDLTTTDFSLTAPIIDTDIPGTYTYYLSQTSPGCSIQSERSEITVVVKPQLSVTLTGSDSKICTGGTLSLNATISPDIYAADAEFSWSPTATLSDPGILNPVASPMISTTYRFIAHSGMEECADTAEFSVTVIPNDITLANENDTVCAGTVIPLNVSGHPDLTYHWAPGSMGIDNPIVQNTFLVADHSGMVYVTASHPGCVDVTDSFYLRVEPNPVLNLGDDVRLCMSDTAHLYASVEPVDFDEYSYTWLPGIKLSDSTIKNPIFTGYSNERYIVTVETPYGCFDVDTIDVIVNASQFLDLTFTDTIICVSDTIQLSASGGVSYKWTPSVGLTDDTIPNPLAYIGSSMTYLVEAKNEYGCVDSKSVHLKFLPSPVVTMPDSVHIFPGESYEIDIVTNGHYFSWFPPEGLSSTSIANPVASPDVRTRYFVSVTSENGCNVLDSIDVVVNLQSVFDVPNAFVPGNSQVNNGEFKILKRGDVELMTFQVYDRWGQLVFETNDINRGWNGQYKEMPQPMGVYVYIVEGRLNSGQIIKRTGDVTLVR